MGGIAMHILTAVDGSPSGKAFEITAAGVKLGRLQSQNQIVVADEEVSRQHARVYLDAEGRVWIEDSSANGTFVNGARIEKQSLLHTGDTIRLGPNPSNTFSYSERRAEGAPAVERSPGGEAPAQSSPPFGTVHIGREEGKAPRDARLQLVVDRYAVHTIPLSAGRTLLGRARGENRVVVDVPGVSDTHAELTFSPEGNALLRDLDSAQGTWVNGERIAGEKVLREGDMIRLGESDARLLLFREARRRALALRDIEVDRPQSRIGRDSANEIRLDHPTVSLFHAEISKRDGTYAIEDKGSTNGTFVNGERVRGAVQLKARDQITLGAIQLSFDGRNIEQQSDGKGVWLNAYSLRREVVGGGQRKVLLDDVSLAVEPREFVGVLGPSGSGKSTLMHSLSGIVPADAGRVLVNQSELYRDRGALRSMIGYVPQDDILHYSLTVRECLEFAARLRLPDDFSEAGIATRVTEVIEKVYLTDHAHKSIFVLSGGQRKRVNLAVELLCNPSLLFLDEPTAGQDPRTEMELMKLFREVANGGSTIILTTHLLGSFNLLDKVVVLVAGKLCYYGPTQELLPYFDAADPTQVYGVLEDRTKPPDYWAKRFQESEVYRDFVANPLGLDAPRPPTGSAPPPKAVTPRERPRYSAARVFSTLFERLLALKFKDWTNIAVLVAPPPLIALVLHLMLPNSPNDPKALFIMVIIAIWFGCSAAIREIVDERQIYSRERQRNLPVRAYLGSKLVFLAGLAGVQSLLLVGFASLTRLEQGHFLVAWLIIWLMTFHGALLGLLISAWSPTAERALFVFPLVLIPQLLFAGSLIPVRTVSVFAPAKGGQSLSYESRGMAAPIRYGIAPFIVSRWGVEALADTYINDRKLGLDPGDGRYYSLSLLNAFSLTFHPHDARKDLEAYKADFEATGARPEATKSDLPTYLAILGGMALAMVAWIAVILKLQEKKRFIGA